MSLENVIEFSARKKIEAGTPHSSELSLASQPVESTVSFSDPTGPHPKTHPKTGLKYNGFFPMRCILFSPELLKALPPGEVVLFLYLTFLAWRYPTKEGFVRASLSYLVEGTGLGRTAIHGYLHHLETLKLIACHEVNYKTGNLYEIQDVLFWKGESDSGSKPKSDSTKPAEAKSSSDGEQSVFRTAGIQTAEIRTAPVQNSDGSSSNFEQEPSGKRTEDYTSLNSSKLSYSLSSTSADDQKVKEKIERYLANLKPHKKRESESKHFTSLTKDYSVTQIAQALGYLQESGLPGSGESCHSPMSYLSQAMNDVLVIVNADADRTRKAAELRTQREIQDQEDQKRRELEDRKHELMAQKFEKAFPTHEAQRDYFRKVQARFPMFDLESLPLRSLAIQAWISESSSPLISQFSPTAP